MVLHETEHRLTVKLNQMIKNGLISDESRIVFVDDGSQDNTWMIIKELHENNPMIGFPTGVVSYERHKRFAGESKYPLKKCWHLLWME